MKKLIPAIALGLGLALTACSAPTAPEPPSGLTTVKPNPELRERYRKVIEAEEAEKSPRVTYDLEDVAETGRWIPIPADAGVTPNRSEDNCTVGQNTIEPIPPTGGGEK